MKYALSISKEWQTVFKIAVHSEEMIALAADK